MTTNEGTKALIEKARDMTLYARTTKHGAVSHADMIDDLADALESRLAARQPSEDEREVTEAEIDKAARALHMAKCCSLSGDSPHDFPEASELFAAGVVLNAGRVLPYLMPRPGSYKLIVTVWKRATRN